MSTRLNHIIFSQIKTNVQFYKIISKLHITTSIKVSKKKVTKK